MILYNRIRAARHRRSRFPVPHSTGALLAAFVLVAVASLQPQTARAGSAAPTEQWPVLALERVPGAYDYPVHLTNAGDGTGRLFVVEKSGLIRILDNGQPLSDPFLDIRDRVNDDCPECGLLSVAFPPDYDTGGYFFVYYTAAEDLADPEPGDNGLDSGNDTVVARFRTTTNPNRADPASEERILIRNQPFRNHNGGMIVFGPDGYLYVALGDGGGAGDPLNSGQTTDTLLGKILRLGVSHTGPYTIPADNPFFSTPGYLPEIWALGLRNPWRIAFDRLLGDLYIADVGQTQYEEVNHQPAGMGGQNYGWKIMEGLHCNDPDPCDQTGLTLPVHEYEHGADEVCYSITGGAVYRGAILHWHGVYFFADYCSGRIFGLRRNTGVWESTQLLNARLTITSFGEDEWGEIYIVGRDGSDPENAIGVVYRLIEAEAAYLPAILSLSAH